MRECTRWELEKEYGERLRSSGVVFSGFDAAIISCTRSTIPQICQPRSALPLPMRLIPSSWQSEWP